MDTCIHTDIQDATPIWKFKQWDNENMEMLRLTNTDSSFSKVKSGNRFIKVAPTLFLKVRCFNFIISKINKFIKPIKKSININKSKLHISS